MKRDEHIEWRGHIVERRKRSGKSPQAKLDSLSRWLKGATPAVKSYAQAAQAARSHHMRDEDAIRAVAETADLLDKMNAIVARLHSTVPRALKGF